MLLKFVPLNKNQATLISAVKYRQLFLLKSGILTYPPAK